MLRSSLGNNSFWAVRLGLVCGKVPLAHLLRAPSEQRESHAGLCFGPSSLGVLRPDGLPADG